MEVDVSTERTIRTPRAVVSRFAADPNNVTRWNDNIRSVEWLTAEPVQLGSQIVFVARFLRRTLRYTYEVIDYVDTERLVMRTADGPFPMQTTYTWSDTNGNDTRMVLRNRGNPSGFSKFVAPLIVPAMRRANRRDLNQLAKLLETS